MKAIYTDEWTTYKNIATEGTKHKTVRYCGGKYAKSDVHKGAYILDAALALGKSPHYTSSGSPAL
jgi:hypothetical protein